MRWLVELCEWVLSGRWSPFQLVIRTLLAAYYVPMILAIVLFLVGLIPYYFWTLFTSPSWLHLYFGLMFVGVVVSLCWSNGDSPPPVRRGRRVLEPPSFGTTNSRSRASRPRSFSKIRRGR